MILLGFKNLFSMIIQFMTLKRCKFPLLKSFRTRIESKDTGVDNNKILSIIKNALKQPPSLHDITIKLDSDLHHYLISLGYNPKTANKLVQLDLQTNDDETTVKASVYPKIIQIHIACSNKPFPITDEGKQRLLSLLGQILAQMCQLSEHKAKFQKISLWVITHYHHGQDSLISYNGAKFEMTMEKATENFSRVYDKEIDGQRIIRIEEIMTPKCTVEEIFQYDDLVPSSKYWTLQSSLFLKSSEIVGHAKA